MREAYRNGTLTADGVHRVLKLDAAKTAKIADFFVREMAVAVPIVPSVIFAPVEKPAAGGATAGRPGGRCWADPAALLSTCPATCTLPTAIKVPTRCVS